jgi:aminopeptidase N
MKLLLLLLFAMFVLPAFSQMPPIEPGVPHDLAIWRAAHYSDVRYKLNLTLEKMSPVLKGTIEIRVKVLEPGAVVTGAVPPIILDWRKITGHEKDSTISNVTINGNSVILPPPPLGVNEELRAEDIHPTFIEAKEHLVFDEFVRPGENLIKLDFTSPILTSGSAITRYIDKEDGSEYIYSLFVPSDASTAFPVFDQPDLKSRFSLDVTCSESWRVVSNTPGRLYRTSDPIKITTTPPPDLGQTLRFAETKPISTYVFAFAAGPWAEQLEPPAVAGGLTQAGSKSKVSNGSPQSAATAAGSDSAAGLTTHIYVRKSQAAKFQPHAAEVFKMTREGIKYLEGYFDYKFPWPKYDLVLIPEFPFGGMEHAGATFLRETGVIFPSEPTANDYISRANLIFHETAHQWFGDTVTMRWFDDLWLKEGFAEFMAYNAWKAFYERNKQAAYLTDSTKGTTPIYQEINNLSAAKSAYGNIVYRKAPSFLRQAEFYLGPDKFQKAVRAFLKKHEFANATWQDLVSEFEVARTQTKSEAWKNQDINEFSKFWVTQPGLLKVTIDRSREARQSGGEMFSIKAVPNGEMKPSSSNVLAFKMMIVYEDGSRQVDDFEGVGSGYRLDRLRDINKKAAFIFPNYEDFGYGIFLLDDKSRDYVLKNIQKEKDDFLRSMMWGALWDSVREAELDPREYVELAIKNLPAEKDETITASVLRRVSTAMTYYMPEMTANAERVSSPHVSKGSTLNKSNDEPASTSGLQTRLETMLIDKMRTATTLGQRVTYYRAFLNIVSTENGRAILKAMLQVSEPGAVATGVVKDKAKGPLATASGSDYHIQIPLKTKDRFDLVTKLAILNDPDAPKLLADLEKAETSDDAKRYAYAARAAFPTKENREKFWNDFIGKKDISESWIEAAMVPFNSPRHSELTLPYLERALAELPNLKRNRKIFFVNGWLGAFIGGQKSQAALDIVNKFLADNPNLDRDLRLKILENVDTIERAVKIRNKFGGS